MYTYPRLRPLYLFTKLGGDYMTLSAAEMEELIWGIKIAIAVIIFVFLYALICIHQA